MYRLIVDDIQRYVIFVKRLSLISLHLNSSFDSMQHTLSLAKQSYQADDRVH
jgi:hypothetical protein